MELSQHGFLEELLASGKDTSWSSYSNGGGFNDFFGHGWSFGFLDENPSMAAPTSSNSLFPAIQTPISDCPFTDQIYTTFLEGFTMPELDSSSFTKNSETTPQFLSREDNNLNPSIVDDGDLGFLENDNPRICKVEMDQVVLDREINNNGGFKMGLGDGKKIGKTSKKIEGQPSKNLMAERRRRKRLNDRLSMLRAIVPKISKMDRTSILGDTIDYMKELLERINNLKEEEEEEEEEEDHQGNVLDSNLVASLNVISKERKPNEVLVRNAPKFDVDSREIETQIEICCATRPGLLLSTVNTLEAFGLEIQQCVISCFNDFSMQASCSQGNGQKAAVNSEDIKEALFKNAGYGGKCL